MNRNPILLGKLERIISSKPKAIFPNVVKNGIVAYAVPDRFADPTFTDV